jgi:molybdate transport system substrate-binding protein
MRALAVASVALVLVAGCGGGAAGERRSGARVNVAAASDLRPAFTELGRRFEQQTGIRVVFSFGSSGQLAEQIVNGAPFDLFASASVGFVDDVLDAGRGDPATKATYAFGRLVVWSREREYRLADLSGPDVRRVAIANPEHAPYGQAAREALQRSGAWPAVEDKLVLGENVSDTQRLAMSGNADAAIVALSLALASEGKWTFVSERLHEPLEQALVVTAEGEHAAPARRFADFVGGQDGRAIMRRYGFLLPGERLADG